MLGIQLSEEVSVCKLMSNFLHSGYLVMVTSDGLVEVMEIQAQMLLAICLLDIGNGGYPVHWFVYMGDHT